MGLLQYINLHYYSKESLHVGLLGLAQKYLEDDYKQFNCDPFLLDKPFFQFHNFSKELELFKTALFIPHNNTFSILFSHNLDNVSIQKSVSSFDFWNGMLTTNSWYTFSENELAPFSQFFSEKDRELISSINVRWLFAGSKRCIFFVCTSNKISLDLTSLDDVLPSLIQDLLPTITNYMPNTSLQNDSFNHLSSQINEGLKIYNRAHCFELTNDNLITSDELTKSEKKYIIFQLFCRMKFATVKPNICFLTNTHTLKFVLFSHENIDPDMYQMYIHQNLEEYFLPENLSQCIIRDMGVYTSKTDIENFLI